jgi:hypothetical protein
MVVAGLSCDTSNSTEDSVERPPWIPRGLKARLGLFSEASGFAQREIVQRRSPETPQGVFFSGRLTIRRNPGSVRNGVSGLRNPYAFDPSQSHPTT